MASGQTEYLDEVEAESVYTYRISAQNAAGRSMPSPLLRVETPVDERPRAPTNLRTSALSRFAIRLAWQDNSIDESGYVIEVQLQDGFAEHPTVLPADTTYVDIEGLAPERPYTFRIRARNDLGDSAPSNVSTSATFPESIDCETRDDRLCLDLGRFKIQVAFGDPTAGPERLASVIPITDSSAVFYFFDRTNPELVFRIFEDPEAGEVRIAFSSLSDMAYRIDAIDTESGELQRVIRSANNPCPAEQQTEFRSRS